MQSLCCNEIDFIRRAAAVQPHLMWFLGAGASRTAGMPTATDIIWDLKRRYYCLHENQDLKVHNVNNQTVRAKIQSYMASRGFPPAGSPDEYAFYFALTFGDHLAEQQCYIADALQPDRIALNVGHRALAAMLDAGLARVVFSSNFDEVVERAYRELSRDTITKRITNPDDSSQYVDVEVINAIEHSGINGERAKTRYKDSDEE
jgi:hypothetical protein